MNYWQADNKGCKEDIKRECVKWLVKRLLLKKEKIVFLCPERDKN